MSSANNIITGYYNRNYFKDQPQNYITIPAFLSEYPNAITVLTVFSNRLVNTVSLQDVNLYYECYTWVTYTDNTLSVKLGQITYDALYPDSGTGSFTLPSIQNMTVLGASGIYANVNEVIMDFTQPPLRTIKFNIVYQ